jgi:hypothetical protein
VHSFPALIVQEMKPRRTRSFPLGEHRSNQFDDSPHLRGVAVVNMNGNIQVVRPNALCWRIPVTRSDERGFPDRQRGVDVHSDARVSLQQIQCVLPGFGVTHDHRPGGREQSAYFAPIEGACDSADFDSEDGVRHSICTREAEHRSVDCAIA